MSRRPVRAATAFLAAAALGVLAACSGDGTSSLSGTATTVGGGDGSTASSLPGRTTGATAGATTAAPTTQEAPAVEGVVSGDVGDAYYPTLGNVGVDAVHYDLDLDYDPATGTVDGLVVLDAVAEVDLAGFDLDLAGLDATAVSVDGRPAPFTQDPTELQITLPTVVEAGAPVAVEVAYSGRFGAAASDSQGFEVGWIVEPWGSYVAAEPDGARRWFPADDHPSDKATFSIAVTVPAGVDVVAAGRMTGQTDVDGDRVRWRFEADEPMATYLMSVAVGDFEIVEDPSRTDVAIRHALPPDFGPDERLALTGEMIDVVGELFGTFPLGTYGVLVVPTELGFALENQTLTLIGTDFMGLPELAETVLVHEVAHQWAGNAVSPQRWSDIWLNEGFATYAEWWWSERRGGRSVADHAAAARASAEAAELGAPLDPGVDGLFGATVYLRGALVVDALRSAVGDESFVEIVQAWFDRHRGGSASTDDFLALVDELAGPGTADVLDPWLTAARVPAA